MTGDPPDPGIRELPGYPHMPMRLRESEYASYWGGSCLAVDGCVYQFLATSNVPYLKPDGSFWPDFCEAHSKLISRRTTASLGTTRTVRHRSSGTTGTSARQRTWRSTTSSRKAFFSPVFLQMGQDYSLNEDGYVYVYSGNGGEDGTANELVMFRVPKARVLDRARTSSSGKRAGRKRDLDELHLRTFAGSHVSTRLGGRQDARVQYPPAGGRV